MNEVNDWETLSRKEQLEAYVWDLYKEVHGIRPRHLRLVDMTEAELEAMVDDLHEVLEQATLARREAEAKAVVRFSKRVEETIKSGAGDRETALRWIMEADDARGDWEYLTYLNGLPYGFFKATA